MYVIFYDDCRGSSSSDKHVKECSKEASGEEECSQEVREERCFIRMSVSVCALVRQRVDDNDYDDRTGEEDEEERRADGNVFQLQTHMGTHVEAGNS